MAGNLTERHIFRWSLNALSNKIVCLFGYSESYTGEHQTRGVWCLGVYKVEGEKMEGIFRNEVDIRDVEPNGKKCPRLLPRADSWSWIPVKRGGRRDQKPRQLAVELARVASIIGQSVENNRVRRVWDPQY